MRWFLAVLSLVAATLSLAPAAGARGWQDQPFDPATLSREDMATLQAALAFSGDYYGFLDGLWNDDAAKALADWTRRERGHDSASYSDLTDLILALEDERVANGWQIFHDSDANISYLFPYKLLSEVENESAIEFLSADKGFSMIIRYDDLAGMQSIHDWFMNKAKPGTDPFRYNDDTRWITSATIDNDYVAYVRSDRTGSNWLSLSIVIDQQYFPQLNLLASSVMVGGSPASLLWTEGGVIDRLVNGDGPDAGAPPVAGPSPNPKDQVIRPRPPGVEAPPEPPAVAGPDTGSGTVDVAGVTPGPAPGGTPPAGGLGTPAPGTGIAAAEAPPEAPAPGPDPGKGALGTPPPGGGSTPAPAGLGTAPGKAPAAPAAPAAPDQPREKVRGTVKGSGSGFYIAPTVLVTAQHVIDGCRAVAMIDGTPLDVMAADPSLDIAVLSGATDAGVWLRLSALEVPKLGEAVTALGYPYYTSLDQGLTVTSGNVSALRGADGSSNRVMITAPVQPGNSGGPLLNRKGAVIGVVVSRMDDLAVLHETGSLPQNMNFALPSGPLLTFLAQNRITRPQGEGSGGEMSGGEVPEGVAKAVVPLHCYE